MEGTQTILEPPESSGPMSSKATEKKPMTFSFGEWDRTWPVALTLAGLLRAISGCACRAMLMIDKSYWSAGPRDDPHYASQQTLYEDLGVDLLDHSFEGFNTCIFACERGLYRGDMCVADDRWTNGKVSADAEADRVWIMS